MVSLSLSSRCSVSPLHGWRRANGVVGTRRWGRSRAGMGVVEWMMSCAVQVLLWGGEGDAGGEGGRREKG
ncbi:hypothetical protein SETIT_6G100800v2 [Setaria italica]|uniref:Uncharacterized protein n=1 Tax=Setaria italica TaxID=4555 RepID=A0A368RKB4_SETIT|nr:hypothetical protein SETIT_6G100800v2 [Setaria italica]